uniref:Transposase n=1 Tax=Haemonchus contortus TaxID=6289 RepID=A0A7I4YZ30_HAECO
MAGGPADATADNDAKGPNPASGDPAWSSRARLVGDFELDLRQRIFDPCQRSFEFDLRQQAAAEYLDRSWRSDEHCTSKFSDARWIGVTIHWIQLTGIHYKRTLGRPAKQGSDRDPEQAAFAARSFRMTTAQGQEE